MAPALSGQEIPCQPQSSRRHLPAPMHTWVAHCVCTWLPHGSLHPAVRGPCWALCLRAQSTPPRPWCRQQVSGRSVPPVAPSRSQGHRMRSGLHAPQLETVEQVRKVTASALCPGCPQCEGRMGSSGMFVCRVCPPATWQLLLCCHLSWKRDSTDTCCQSSPCHDVVGWGVLSHSSH